MEKPARMRRDEIGRTNRPGGRKPAVQTKPGPQITQTKQRAPDGIFPSGAEAVTV